MNSRIATVGAAVILAACNCDHAAHVDRDGDAISCIEGTTMCLSAVFYYCDSTNEYAAVPCSDILGVPAQFEQEATSCCVSEEVDDAEVVDDGPEADDRIEAIDENEDVAGEADADLDSEEEEMTGECSTLFDCPRDGEAPGNICEDHACVPSALSVVYDTQTDRPSWEDDPTNSGEEIHDLFYSAINDEVYFVVVRWSHANSRYQEQILAMDSSGSTRILGTGSNRYARLAGAHTSTFPLTLVAGLYADSAQPLLVLHGGSSFQIDVETACGSLIFDPVSVDIMNMFIRPGTDTYEIFLVLDFSEARPLVKLNVTGSIATCSSVVSADIQLEDVSATDEAVYSVGNGIFRDSAQISTASFISRVGRNHRGLDNVFAGNVARAFSMEGSTVTEITAPVSPWTASGIHVSDLDYCGNDKLVIGNNGYLLVNYSDTSDWYAIELGSVGFSSMDLTCSPDNDILYIKGDHRDSGSYIRGLIYRIDLEDAISSLGQPL